MNNTAMGWLWKRLPGKKERIAGGIFGVAVGDALGLSVEFRDREYLKEHPVTTIKGYGTYLLPPGAWSDDTSLTLCTVDALLEGYSPERIAAKFLMWFNEGLWTPYGTAFDIGRTTRKALLRLEAGVSPLEAGLDGMWDNGNGSLMRIFPVVAFVKNKPMEEQLRIVHEVSSITHKHPISLIACGIYTQIVVRILEGFSKEDAIKEGISVSRDYYLKDSRMKDYLDHFDRIFESIIFDAREEEISSSGYVVDTLETALWCFTRTNSYKQAVLKAVNLGGDTDTVGAVTGGLAGAYYSIEQIPKEWIEIIERKEAISRLIANFIRSLEKEGATT